MSNDLGKRMKKYENVFCSQKLLNRVPVIIRVDGRSFHSFVKKFHLKQPFDEYLIDAMIQSAKFVAENLQGFKLGYVYSDEASFLITDYDRINSSGFFGYKTFKINSIVSSLMSLRFKDFYTDFYNGFDCRCFNVPKEDIPNYFLWRLRDCERNSLNMYARSFFSHKELQNKNKQDIHEMLYKIGQNWTSLDDKLKNGIFLIKKNKEIEFLTIDFRPTYEDLQDILKDKI